jgi:hypothetical protein
MQEVKCAGCGLFAAMEQKTKRYRPATLAERATGIVGPNTDYAICSAHEFDLSAEDDKTPAGRVTLAMRPRPCQKFILWRPGLSLRGHLEMQALTEQREFARQMADAERAWREQDRIERAEEAMRVAARHRQDARAETIRFWLGFGVLIVVTAAAQILAQVILDRIKPTATPPAPQVIMVTAPPQQIEPPAKTEPPPDVPANP